MPDRLHTMLRNHPRKRLRPAPRTGLLILSVLTAVALLGPCLAGGRPLLLISSAGIESPALRRSLSLTPWETPAPRVPEARAGGWALLPPVRHEPLAIDLDAILSPPSAAHWLGSDELGRDVFARLIHGARSSLLVAAIATAVSLLLGIPIGAAAGYSGAWWGLILSRLIEASLSFPSLVLLLLLTALTVGGGATPGVAGRPEGGVSWSLLMVGCAVGIARWGVIARYMRGEVLRLKQTDMADSARAAGAAPLRVVSRHLVPAGLSPVIISAAFGAGTAVVAEASLSFLGMGVQPPAPTWGQMIASAAEHGGHWWMLLFPGAMVALTVAAFNLVGESLRRRAA